MFFSPLGILFFIFLVFIAIFLFIFIHIGLITIAFERLGLSEFQAFSFLLISLLGSNINFPIKRIKGPPVSPPQDVVRFFGVPYRIPEPASSGDTIIAINLGGAIVPFILSCYLMAQWKMFFEPLLATLVVAVVTYKFARPVPGIGIAVPVFVPPIIAALIALFSGQSLHAPALAYIAATMGTLLGADIFHLNDIKKIRAPVASIGGAGTFDGIFLAGIIAVILA